MEHARGAAEEILEYKEIGEYKYEKGFTPLHYASLYGHEEVARELIEAGANIECKSTWCRTPLHCAVERGFENIVVPLLDKFASVDPKTKVSE